MSSNAANDVVCHGRNLYENEIILPNHEPCLIHVEAEHAEANVIPDISIGNRPCVGVCAQLRAPDRRGKNNDFELRRC